MTKFVAIVSSKGGTGKTTLAVNLGSALNHYGRDLILVDGNLRNPNVTIHLGLTTLPNTINDVMNKDGKVTDAVYRHHSGLKIIPASIAVHDLKGLDISKFKKAILKLKNVCEVVLIDTPPSITDEHFDLLEIADEIIIITHPELPSLTDTLRIIKLSEKAGHNIIGIVVNSIHNKKFEVHRENIEGLLGKPVIAEIPFDMVVKESIRHNTPVVKHQPNSKASKEIYKLASMLIGYVPKDD
ncbi:cell division ATPase MinD [Candidatus Woesearchaeota archaeon]|nr:cell division ATPase MinD [Candidatus Woesearchaeota archaeon]